MSSTTIYPTVTVDHRPSKRAMRSETRPWAVTACDGEVAVTARCGSREAAMERAAALAGVKL